MAESAHPISGRRLPKLLLAIGLVYSIIVTARIGSLVASQQPIWPFPGLYFVELIVLPALAAFSAIQEWHRRTCIAAASGGALLSFALLGAWSVGLAYLPLALLLLAAAFVSRLATRETPLTVIAVTLLTGAVQAIAMLGLASLL